MQGQNSHIYIYGELTDYLTRQVLPDTDDERIRQSLSHLLIDRLGFFRNELVSGRQITTSFAGQEVISTIDIIACIEKLPLMALRCAPGSLVSRERAAIAAARICDLQHQLPLAVVYNGRDAELLDCYTGKVLATGIGAIPSRKELEKWQKKPLLPPQESKAQEREKRILNTFDKQYCCLSTKFTKKTDAKKLE